MARRVDAQRRRRSVRASRAGTVKATVKAPGTGVKVEGPPRLPALGLEGEEEGIGMGLERVGTQQGGDEAGRWSGLETSMMKEMAIWGGKGSGEGSEADEEAVVVEGEMVGKVEEGEEGTEERKTSVDEV